MTETEAALGAMWERLREESTRPAAERFRELVDIGLIDEEGRFVRLADDLQPND